MTKRFDNTDRKRVISLVETHLDVTLSPVGTRHIYLKDQADRRYCVIGGYENWHGIPDDVVEDMESAPGAPVLVIATMRRNALRVYCGDMTPLLKGRSRLKRMSNDKSVFNVTERGDHLFIDQIPSASLAFVKELPHGLADRSRVEKAEAFRRLVEKLSREERGQLLKRLQGGTSA